MIRKGRLGLLKVAVSLGLLALLLTRVDLSSVGQTLRAADMRLIAAALGLGCADRILQAAKWRLLLTSSGTQIGFGAAVVNTYVGNFAGLFLPASVGGDVVRVWLLRETKLPTAEVVASILVERAFGVLALVLAAGAGVLLADTLDVPVPAGMATTVLVATGVLLLAIVASFRLDISGALDWVGRVGARFSLGELAGQLPDSYRRYGKRKPALFTFLILSVIEVGAIAVMYGLTVRALGLDTGWLPLLVVVPAVLFLQRLPISIDGLGVSEGAITWFLIQLGETPEAGLAVAVAMRLVGIAIILPGGLLWWRRPQ